MMDTLNTAVVATANEYVAAINAVVTAVISVILIIRKFWRK